MKHNKRIFNQLLLKYNKSKRRLLNLQQLQKNKRRQSILQKSIERLYEKLMALKMSFKLTTATAALAIGVLAFAPQTTQAQTFAPVQTNPFSLTDVGYYSTPTFGDLDGDGDLDMISGEYYGSFKYFQNTGTAIAPVYAPVQTNPFGLTALSFNSAPTFVDLDGDGDLDIMSGENYGNFRYFQNTGTSTLPVFGPIQTNPFGLTGVGQLSVPSFADLDGDGDLDLISGKPDGQFFYYQNIGTSISPVYATVQIGVGGLTDIGTNSKPSFADLDNDGDLEMMGGAQSGNFFYFQNTGTPTSPLFAAVQTNPFGLTDIGFESRPTLVDIDGDGDLDVLAGEFYGSFFYFENITCTVADQTVNATPLTICDSGSSTINLGSSETGVNYFLRNNTNDSIINKVSGTGSSVAINTNTINTTTTYNVYGTNAGAAVDLPANTDLIQFNSPFSAYTNEITVEAWVDFKGTQLRAGQSSPGSDNMATNVWLWDAGSWLVNDGSTWRGVAFPSTIPVGWTHVATVANATGMFIYYNGVLVASNTSAITGTIRNNPASIINLGHDPRFAPSVRNTNDSYDNFRVWSTARTGSEVSSNLFTCLTGTEPGLVQYTLFEENTGTVINSITGANGAITNATPNPWILGATVCPTCELEMTQLVTITVNSSSTSSISPIACNTYTSPSGKIFTTSNTYMDTIANAAMCDSIITINLTVNSSNTGTDTQVACGSYTWPLNSMTYNASTTSPTFNIVGGNAAGCDSLVTLNLTINSSTAGTDTQVACGSYTWPLNSMTYTASTTSPTFNIVGGNAAGCDSLVTLNLTINTVDISVTSASPMFTANATSATYQWVDCNNSYATISGETNASFNATANGDYAVIVTQNGCTDTSACLNVTGVGINEVAFNSISVYPNPTTGITTINLGNNNIAVSYVITTIDGRIITQQQNITTNQINIDLTNQSNGVYFIKLFSQNSNTNIKLIKN